MDTHLPLAPRDLLILAVLAEGPLHGYGIIKAVEMRSQSGVFLDPANLYRVLRRMRSLGWIKEGQGQPVSSTSVELEARAESRRRIYHVTSHGRTLLGAELARLERLLAHARPALAGGEGSR